jgi:metacaspase-1
MEFEQYKTNRTKEISAKYDVRISALASKYNRLMYRLSISRLTLDKSGEMTRLKMAQAVELAVITKQMNAEISTIKMPPPIDIVKSTKKALLVGINYINSTNELNGCINDVENVSKSLVGFKSIVKLTDNTATKPTRNNILNEFKKLLMNSVAGDCLLFHFSGHGSQTVDRNGDETDMLDECLYTVDDKYIKDDELNLLIRAYLKKNVTLFAIMDCCHSGTILDLKYHYLDYTENPKNVDVAGNVIMISGSRDDQYSSDAYINSTYQGAMTWAFLNNLKPQITWRQLVTNMHTSLTESEYTQIPKLTSGKFVDIDSKFLFA